MLPDRQGLYATLAPTYQPGSQSLFEPLPDCSVDDVPPTVTISRKCRSLLAQPRAKPPLAPTDQRSLNGYSAEGPSRSPATVVSNLEWVESVAAVGVWLINMPGPSGVPEY